jgi:hypothetical protein
MKRRKIEVAFGSLAPVSRNLWSAAVEKLHEAEFGLSQMNNAQDRIEFEQGWTRVVDSLEEFWTRFFDEGKNRFSGFQPWAGAIYAQRKKDPLLKYLIQARHQSQHGRISLEWESGQLNIAPGFNGHIRGIKVFPDGTFELEATPAHSTVPDPIISFSGGSARLPLIVNKKHKDRFQPPTAHFEDNLKDVSPKNISRLGLQFYFMVLERAFKKFGNKE